MLGDFAQHIMPVIFHPAQLRLGALDVGLSCGGEEPVLRAVHEIENPQVLACQSVSMFAVHYST